MSRLSQTSTKLAIGAGVLVVLAIGATPNARSFALTGFADFLTFSERVARIPSCIVDPSRCFSLDRLDPTCPRCI